MLSLITNNNNNDNFNILLDKLIFKDRTLYLEIRTEIKQEAKVLFLLNKL